MNIAIIQSNGIVDQQLHRILKQHRINGDFVKKLTQKTLQGYDAIIFTYQCKIPNISKVMEMACLERESLIIYVHNTVSKSNFSTIEKHIYFEAVFAQYMESVLPVILKRWKKSNQYIEAKQKEINYLKEDLVLLKSINKAKRQLIKQGLPEDVAHHFIQHYAMDKRMSKQDVVNLIIANKIDKSFIVTYNKK